MGKYIIAFLMLIVILVSPGKALADFTESQKEVLRIAYEEGSKIGYQSIIQAIVLHESIAGIYKEGDSHFKKRLNRSFGAMQLRLKTAKMVIEMYGLPVIYANNTELMNILMNDVRLNIQIGTLYFKYLLRINHYNVAKAILSYNVGQKNIQDYGLDFDPNNYLQSVTEKSKYFASINRPAKAKVIQAKAQVQTEKVIYTVVKGDTLDEIATNFNTTVYELAVKNHIDDVDYIEVGQELII